MKTQSEEILLAAKARSGDKQALDELVARVRRGLFLQAYADLRQHDDARDAVANAIVPICLYIGKLRDEASVQPWLSVIVRNEVRRLRRRSPAGSLPLLEGDALAGPAVPPSDGQTISASAGQALKVDVQASLRQIPFDQARAVVLFYLQGNSVQETAERARPTGCNGENLAPSRTPGARPFAEGVCSHG